MGRRWQARQRRRRGTVVLAAGIVLAAVATGVLLSAPGAARAGGCPQPPFSFASVIAVPESQRAACFGRAEITFAARGGLLEAVFPVVIDGRFGDAVWFGDPNPSLDAWKPTGLALPADDAHALAMTSPGMGLDGWTDVRWRVRGHFADPIASGCTPDARVTPALTPAQAVEWCRDQFVIDALSWLKQPQTDAELTPGPAPSARMADSVRTILLGVLAGLAVAAALVRRAAHGPRQRRAGYARLIDEPPARSRHD